MVTRLSPEVEAVLQYASFSLALWGSLFSKKGHDDKDIIECHDEVLNTISDGDKVNKIDLHTGKNVRDQLTVEQAIQLNEEREEARWWWRRG